MGCAPGGLIHAGQGLCADDVHPSKPILIKGKDVNFQTLYSFKIPEKSLASDEFPLHVEVAVAPNKIPLPASLDGYVLIPASKNDQKANPSSIKYTKLPFGRMDLLAPANKEATILLFPYEDAQAVRRHVKPGDTIFVGVRVIPTKSTPNSEKLDEAVKIRRVHSW